MGDAEQDPDLLYRRHECLKRLLGEAEQFDTERSKAEEQDQVAAECDRLAQESLRLLDLAYLTGNESIISTAVSLWNMAIDHRRYKGSPR
jgi:hypothetical protein